MNRAGSSPKAGMHNAPLPAPLCRVAFNPKRMPDDNALISIRTLMRSLHTAVSFEDAANAVLRATLKSVARPIVGAARGTFLENRHLLRAVVHLRPNDHYQRLFEIEPSTQSMIDSHGCFTSANVWRCVAEHRCSVSIAVQPGLLHAHLPEGDMQRRATPDTSGIVPGTETRDRMLSRNVSHAHFVPLQGIGGDVAGMIALEARCKGAAAFPMIWEDCREELAFLASIAAPYLIALPSQRVAKVLKDDLLPVIGRATAGIIELLRVFAAQEETVLISGPTGAGKSRLARWCHEQSGRKGFETLDLLAVPEELQMAELFGWRKGAFTGAGKDSVGAIARASEGTLFLDEIDKLSLKAQAGLLRVMEERCYRPLGDDGNVRTADVRFIVGTNADLRASVKAGTFREDLYYRINVLPVRLPALAERMDELPLWAEYMLARRHKDAGGKGPISFSRGALSALARASFPGNLRQLDNIVRRAYAIALSERRGASGDFLISQQTIERSLAYESGTEAGNVIEMLWRAATGFVGEAVQREAGSSPLTLDMIEAIRGMALVAAVERCGGRDEAFTLLGQQQLLKSRNHHRAYRREIARVQDIVKALGGEVDPALAAALSEPDE